MILVEIASWFFGLLGGLIVLLYLGSGWFWMKRRIDERAGMKMAEDLKMGGYMLLVIGVWFMCGVLGPPGSLLRPEIVSRYGTLEMAVSISYTVMTLLMLGFLLIFLGQWRAYKARSQVWRGRTHV